jgi:ABC-type uncharacterized transport system, permease component
MSIQLIKRGKAPLKRQMLVKLIAVLLAFVSIGIFLLFLKVNPLLVYKEMFVGALKGAYNIRQTITKAIPICICALGLSIAYKMNFWNIGAEGQIFMGGIGACVIGLFTGLRGPLGIIIMCIVGMFFAGLWAVMAAFLKVKWGTNETIITLMLNSIALKIVTYLQYVAWKNPKAMGFPKITEFSSDMSLPRIFGINIGWILAGLLTIFVYLYMKKSKLGYEAAVIGNSEATAKYVGMNTTKTILLTVFMSGAICGLAGVIQASTVNRTLSVDFTQNAGNLAIIVAWIGNLHPVIMAAVSVIFAALIQGSDSIQMSFNISSAISEIIQATVLFFVLGSEFFLRFQIRFKKKNTTKKEVGA